MKRTTVFAIATIAFASLTVIGLSHPTALAQEQTDTSPGMGMEGAWSTA